MVDKKEEDIDPELFENDDCESYGGPVEEQDLPEFDTEQFVDSRRWWDRWLGR